MGNEAAFAISLSHSLLYAATIHKEGAQHNTQMMLCSIALVSLEVAGIVLSPLRAVMHLRVIRAGAACAEAQLGQEGGTDL